MEMIKHFPPEVTGELTELTYMASTLNSVWCISTINLSCYFQHRTKLQYTRQKFSTQNLPLSQLLTNYNFVTFMSICETY